MSSDDDDSTAPGPSDLVLLTQLGSGRGGTVYRGLFRGEACLIKRPSAATSENASARAAFERDVLQLARLNLWGLPRIVHLAAPHEAAYAVLAPPTGQTIAAWLDACPSPRAALEAAVALTQALCQLHALGYLHADLSADRVWISELDGVQLLDFGSIQRRVPFDPAPDIDALHELLTRLSGAHAGSALANRVQAWQRSGKAPPELLRTLSALRAQLAGGCWIISGLGRGSLPASPKLASTIRGELVHLQQRYLQESLGPITVVTAPAGAGKTRLLCELSEFLQTQSVHVLAVTCSSSACTPFSTIQRLLENHLRDLEVCDAATRDRYEATLRSAAGLFGASLGLLSARLDRLFQPSSLSIRGGDARAAFIDGLADVLTRYLDRLGRSVIVIDDLQYLDASSRMVLARLATRLRPKRQFVIGAMRTCGDEVEVNGDNDQSLDRFDAMFMPGLLQRIPLGALSELDAHAIAAEYLGAPELSYAGVVEPLSNLSDGSSRCLISLLELALEQRLLRPRAGLWHLDVAPLRQTRLPASSYALLDQRLSLLDEQMLNVLRAAAIVGTQIDAELIGPVAAVDDARARAALDRASADALMQRDAEGRYAFVHDCVREALLRGVSEADKRALHQAVADAMRAAASAPDEFTLARHLALGEIERAAATSVSTLQHAGLQAAHAYDDALTLLFLDAAERAAQAARVPLDRAFYLYLAEAHLRTGEVTESLRHFEAALVRSQPGHEAAHVLGRVAWLHHFDGRASACWNALTAALRELGAVVPQDAPSRLLQQALGQRQRNHRFAAQLQRTDKDQLETLCELYVLCMRVSLETGHRTRCLGALWHLLNAARSLPPCRVLVDAELLKSFTLSSLGKHAPYQASLQRAYAIAEQLGDPFAQAKCHQIHHVLAGWRGELDEWERQARLCLEIWVSYIELGELCHMGLGLYVGHVVLGKPEQGFRWIERVCARAQQLGHAPAMFALLEEAACTHLLEFGRPDEAADLKRRLAHLRRSEVEPDSHFSQLRFQQRAQQLVHRGRLGDELDALEQQWRGMGQPPDRAHLPVALYYVHIAHARMHECLRALHPERQALLSKLEAALSALESVWRMPVISAHVYVIRACRDFLVGREDAAEASLVRAERLAREHHGVWVTYAAARLRAHMFKARGQLLSAREQARVAAQLAREYGPPARLRAICEEFDLCEHVQTDSPSTRQHLDALLHIAQASGRDLSPERQAQFVLDELLRTLGAERGFLFMCEAGSGALHCRAARRHDGHDLSAQLNAAERNLVEQVYATGRTALAAPALVGVRAGVAVALVLQELVVGVIYLDRSGAVGAFSAEAVTLIEALAHQVPVVLELAHTLRERAQLERNLREAQKMEAIGRLAGGIAHDFNNILGAIEFSASCLTDQVTEQASEDLADIRDAASRGAGLTKQLMLFARGQTVPKERVDLCGALTRLEPMLTRMLRSQVRLELQLPKLALCAMAEPGQFERLLMNLCRNASDAMPKGGVISVQLSHSYGGPQHSAAEPGKAAAIGYAELCVKDTGFGMSEETSARMFEPFFTTKSESEGTGLGLSIVYAIVQQCEGHISVVSAPERGTIFRVYLPLCEEPARSSTQDTATAHRQEGLYTVCVVDDDESYRGILARVLSRAGYAVLCANSGKEAVRVISAAPRLPELVITDVNMPEMDGPELALRLRESQPQLKVLFISGGQRGAYERARASSHARFLQKPFSAEVLLHEIELLLDDHAGFTTPAGPAFGDAFS